MASSLAGILDLSEDRGELRDGGVDQADTIIASMGSSFADMNNMISEQLNQDFEIANLLPYGKFISDILGLAVGYYSFETSCRGGEAYLVNSAPAPIHSLPPNPFTGNTKDKDCLLECISAVTPEEEELKRKDLYARFCSKYRNCVAPKELFLCVARHNGQVQQLLAIIDDEIEKPQEYKLKPIFKTRAARPSQVPKDSGPLEQLMVALSKGCGKAR
ncbi:mediator complex subunit MED8 [Besnoitia besnoiti]|uniref:Mediator complex subunit MED8 n=1 Tax=Besnoitia besnoiti TaxID=94643 RepID=A0A2A9MB85_BESBE|nr:mediator complex subunit MED8 [Besnoitia besnoiti]PFH33561.1 mediator complex subunit MED8 [Besnoitia besnoiti]